MGTEPRASLGFGHPGARRELSVSRKQDSSCAHSSQDPGKSLGTKKWLGHPQQRSSEPSSRSATNAECVRCVTTCDCLLRVTHSS